MMTPEQLERLLRRPWRRLPKGRYDDASASEPSASEPSADACEARTALLRPVMRACEAAWASSALAYLDAMAQKLADGSRDVAWRLPLGESSLLDFFLMLLVQDSLYQGLQINALRLVGNSCADTDRNRARVVAANRLSSVSRHLCNEQLLPFAIPVLYNVMLDYEPAQQLASRSSLSRELLVHLSRPNLSKRLAVVVYASKILALLAEQDGEISRSNSSTVNILLGLAAEEPSWKNLECLLTLVETIVVYLDNEDAQARLIVENYVGLFLDAFHHIHTGWRPQDIEDSDVAERLKHLRSALLVVLADVSGNDLFASQYPLSSTVAQTFLPWMHANNRALQTAACLALGNLARSYQATVKSVEEYSIHLPIVKILENPAVDSSQLLHAALSFSRNLAIPPPNKAKLGNLLAPKCIPRLLSLYSLPQVQFAAMKATRLLLLDCPENARHVCGRLSTDPLSPDHDRTTLAVIISLFGKSDDEPTKVEAARSIAALCRALYSPAASDILQDWRQDGSSGSVEIAKASNDEADSTLGRTQFLDAHNLSGLLEYLVGLQKWPALRSEAWFILALMSRSVDGAAIVNDILEVQAVTDALVEVVTGRRTSLGDAASARQIQAAGEASTVDELAASLENDLQLEQPSDSATEQYRSVAAADRENALVLCTQLLKNGETVLPPARRGMLKGLVMEGARLLAADRAEEYSLSRPGAGTAIAPSSCTLFACTNGQVYAYLENGY